jgi:hypothetical protein
MCVAQEGSTSVGQNTSTGPALIQLWHKVIDWADGGAGLNF